MTDATGGDRVVVELAGVRLGISRQDVHITLGKPDRTFRRGQSTRPTDVWQDRGVFTTYDERERVALVEVAEGDPIVAGVQLMRRPLNDVATDLAKCDLLFEAYDDGAGGRIVGWGVGLYVEVGIVKAVSIGW